MLEISCRGSCIFLQRRDVIPKNCNTIKQFSVKLVRNSFHSCTACVTTYYYTQSSHSKIADINILSHTQMHVFFWAFSGEKHGTNFLLLIMSHFVPTKKVEFKRYNFKQFFHGVYLGDELGFTQEEKCPPPKTKKKQKHTKFITALFS